MLLVERMQHFLLLLLIIASVNVFRLILLGQLCVGFYAISGFLLLIDLSLHVGQMGLLLVRLLGGRAEAAWQILTHTNHASVVARWGIDC